MSSESLPDERPDEELVRAAARGDDSAFEQLYRRHRDWVVSVAWRFTRNREDALDALQDTFVYLARRLPTLRLTARLRTFLYPVVRSCSIDIGRKRKHSAPNGDTVEAVLEAQAELPAEPDTEDLARVVEVLPDGQREVLLLRFVDGLSLDEIAAALEVPLGTVKSRLHNALGKLREGPGTRRYLEP